MSRLRKIARVELTVSRVRGARASKDESRFVAGTTSESL